MNQGTNQHPPGNKLTNGGRDNLFVTSRRYHETWSNRNKTLKLSIMYYRRYEAVSF